MIDQIRAGINEAISSVANRDAYAPRTGLLGLTEADKTDLTMSILAALGQTPTDTPEPVIASAPAAPVLVLSPAAVVAYAAQAALSEVHDDLHFADNPGAPTLATMATGDDYREFREYLFRIQPLFGVRMRSVRADDGTAWFKIAGYEAQIDAFQRTALMIRDLATPVITDLSPDQRREFWATLGTLCAEGTDNSDHLHESNRHTYAEATAYLTEALGPARTLPRTAPASSGAVYEQAAAVMGLTEGQS